MPRLPWWPRREPPRATIVSPTDPHARPRSSRLEATTEDGQRLRAYLYWLALVTLAFGVLEMVLWVMERTPIRGWIAIGLAVLVIVILIARRAIDRGRAEQAAIGVAIAAFTVIILAGVWSHAEAPLAIAPLLAVVLAVPFVRGAYLLMLMGLGWAVIVLVAAFQQVGPAATAEPGPASALIAIVSTATVAALLLVLVWQHSARLNGIVQAVRTRQAEAEDAELRFRSLFDGVPIGLYRTTSDGRILDANKALAEMLAYPDRDELLATPAQLLYSDPSTRGPIVDRLEREHSQDREMELQRRDGARIWVRDRARAVRDGVTGEVSFEGVMEDVTLRHEAEAQLRRRNAELEALHETTLGLIERLDVQAVLERIVAQAGRLIDCPHAYLYLVEEDRERLSVRYATGVFVPFLGASIRRGEGVAGRVLESGQALAVEDYATWDGRLPGYEELRFHATIGVPIRSAGTVIGVIGLARLEKGQPFKSEEIDLIERFARLASLALENARLFSAAESELAERRVAEERLSVANDFLARVMESATDVILAVDAGGRIQLANASAAALTGRDPSRLVGARVADLVGRDDAERIAEATSQALAGTDVSGIETTLMRPDGSMATVVLSHRPLFEGENVTGVVVTAHDVTARKQLEDELVHQAFHDPLTGLANRALLRDRIEHALARRTSAEETIAVMILDLDGFKDVNDSLGHAAGDQLLRAVADRLRGSLRSADTIARLGGDEFAVLLDRVASRDEAAEVVQRLLDDLQRPIHLAERPIVIGASVGIAFEHGAADVDALLRNADVAMYRAKARGKGRYAIFELHMHEAAVQRLELDRELRQALTGDQLALVYQPVVDLGNGRIEGFEALLRWNHPTRGLVGPDQFIPIAEETGLIVPIGHWVLREACQQAVTGFVHDGRELMVSVNLSPLQLADPALVGAVRSVLDETGMAAHRLMLEITETAVMRETSATLGVMRELRALGIRLALDDFGTGYSSLSHLTTFPLDALKIDRSFVARVTHPREGALVETVIRLARALRLDVVAEGIETADQERRLSALGCRFAQGFRFSRPVDITAVAGLLARGSLRAGAASVGVRRMKPVDRDGAPVTVA